MKICGFGNLRWLKSYPAVPGMPSIIFIRLAPSPRRAVTGSR